MLGVAMAWFGDPLHDMRAFIIPRFGNCGKPTAVGITPAKGSFMSHFYNHYHYFYKFDRL